MVSREYKFEAIPYNSETVWTVLARVIVEVFGYDVKLETSGSTLIATGISKSFHNASDESQIREKLAMLADGKRKWVEAFYHPKRAREYVCLRLRWKSTFSIGIQCQDEAELGKLLDILVSELNLTELPDKSTLETKLSEINESLARRYQQACRDIEDEERLSYNGAVHELRDVLANVLRELAPADEVTRQEWFVQDSNTSGPTQVQRGRYILRVVRHRSGRDVKTDETAIELVAELTRNIYQRASAAHTEASHDEALQIQRLVEAVLTDLLKSTPDKPESK